MRCSSRKTLGRGNKAKMRSYSMFYYLFKLIIFVVVRAKGRGREKREREVRETSIGGLPYTPWPGMEPDSLWCTGQCFNQLSLTGQGVYNILEQEALQKASLHISWLAEGAPQSWPVPGSTFWTLLPGVQNAAVLSYQWCSDYHHVHMPCKLLIRKLLRELSFILNWK